jgi:hypothetical protein
MVEIRERTAWINQLTAISSSPQVKRVLFSTSPGIPTTTKKQVISMGRHCTHTQHNRGEALEVARELRISLAKHGITIPALVSTEGRTLNTQLQPLIQLGSVTVDTAEALLDALRHR